MRDSSNLCCTLVVYDGLVMCCGVRSHLVKYVRASIQRPLAPYFGHECPPQMLEVGYLCCCGFVHQTCCVACYIHGLLLDKQQPPRLPTVLMLPNAWMSQWGVLKQCPIQNYDTTPIVNPGVKHGHVCVCVHMLIYKGMIVAKTDFTNLQIVFTGSPHWGLHELL